MRRFNSALKMIFLAAVAGIALPGLALAHSFNVTMIVPAGGSVQAMQAFLLASAERDAHAGEESDGHLGGLDVYITTFEQDENIATLPQRVLASEPDIIALVGANLATMGLEAMFDASGAWLLPVYSAGERASQEFLSADSTQFAQRFSAQTGEAAGNVAELSYAAARLIDLAVQAQGGAADVGALQAAIAGY